MPEEEDKKANDEPKAKSGPNIIIVIVALLVIQALVAFAVVMFAIPRDDDLDRLAEERRNPENEVSSASSSIDNEVVLPVRAEITVNIAGTDGMRFLRARIALAYDGRNRGNRQLESTLIGMETQLRHKMNEYLSSLTLAQVNDRNIRRIISSELLAELNNLIPASAGRLSNVYVEEFIIQ